MNQQFSRNPSLSQAISTNPVFAKVADTAQHEATQQRIRYKYVYSISDSIIGGQSSQFQIQIEQGTDFRSLFMLGSAFSYDNQNASDFPIPNAGASTAWAGRGLSVRIVDTRTSRTLTAGYVPFETLFTPGYGLNYQKPLDWRYYFLRNTILRFDIENADNANRTHQFSIALIGYKLVLPDNT